MAHHPATVPPGSIAVFGLGNVLMRDDAFGPSVIERLRARYDLGPEVLVEDLGTPGLDLYTHLADLEVVILVDTVRDEGPPGTLRRYDREAISAHAPGLRISPHDPGLRETLLGFELAGTGPREVVLLGAVPQDVGYDVGLTPLLEAAVDPCIVLVLAELRRLGVDEARTRLDPAPEPPWWERSATP